MATSEQRVSLRYNLRDAWNYVWRSIDKFIKCYFMQIIFTTVIELTRYTVVYITIKSI